jgi:hypothetical protein
MTPPATQGASFQEYCSPDAGTVMSCKTHDVENETLGHRLRFKVQGSRFTVQRFTVERMKKVHGSRLKKNLDQLNREPLNPNNLRIKDQMV